MGHPQTAISRTSRASQVADCGSHLRTWAFRSENGCRLVRLQTRRSNGDSVGRGHKNRSRGIGTIGFDTPQDQRRGNRRACPLSDDQRGRPYSRGRHCAASLGYRCRLHRGLWVPGFSGRPHVLRRHGRTAEHFAHHARLREGLSARRLETCAAIEEAGLRKSKFCQLEERIMTDAVVVSTARTGLAKSWRGSLNMTHPVTFTGHVLRHAIDRAGLEPAEVEDVIVGATFLEGAAGMNVARQVALRAGCPVTTAGVSINRFCSSGLQTIAMASQRIMSGEGEVYAAGGLESISCIQNQANLRMLKEQWLVQNK